MLQHPPGFAGLRGDEGFPTPGSMSSHHTPDQESPGTLELQSRACGVGGEDREQTTRYTSATHRALPKQRLFPNSHFPNKTQLNQETPSLCSSKHMQWKPTQLHGHRGNVPTVAPGVFVWGRRCSHSPPATPLEPLVAEGLTSRKKEGKRGITCCQWPMRNFKGQLDEKQEKEKRQCLECSSTQQQSLDWLHSGAG